MKKEEEEGLAPPLLPEEAKEDDEVPPLHGAGEMLVAIPFLHGERHVLIDPLAMVIPLHFLWDDFLNELGILLHQNAKQNYQTKAPWRASFSVSPFQAHAVLGPSH